MNQVKTINELINRTWRARTGDGARAHSVCLSVRNDDRTRARGGHRRRGGKVAVHDVGFAANVSVARANRTDYFSRIYSRPFAS